jgi:hypothetical protein
MTATTTVPLIVNTAALEAVQVDIYRDIHKGIRAGLFAVTQSASAVDPHDQDAVRAVADQWTDMVQMLVEHAEHEDHFVQPVIERFAPAYAAEIAAAHPRLEAQMAQLEVLADRAADACPDRARLLNHRLYLGLASFTAEYLQHQEFEEFEVMVMLSQHLSPDELHALDAAIIASVSPERMAASAALMLPAMNIEDQVELYEGARAGGVPPEALQGMLMLAEMFLEPTRYQALVQRLGV